MTESSKQEIVTLEAELALAQVNNDIAVLDRLLADEIIFTDPQGVGSLITKAQDIVVSTSLWLEFPNGRIGLPERSRVLGTPPPFSLVIFSPEREATHT